MRRRVDIEGRDVLWLRLGLGPNVVRVVALLPVLCSVLFLRVAACRVKLKHDSK